MTDNYQNLSSETSTVFQVIQTGQPVLYCEQQLTTLNGFSYLSLSSTYPIMEHGKAIGAIEFSKHFYESKQIKYLDNFWDINYIEIITPPIVWRISLLQMLR